jgi:GntR family transcriptional repressor for pyruvate dehydrogenase complex
VTKLERPDGLPQRVKETVLQMISGGELERGDRLPPERELAATLGVSRNVVREAIHSLAAMRIIDVRQGSGNFVSALDAESMTEPLEFAVSLEKGTVLALLEARLVLEPAIARIAATRASDEDLDELDDCVSEAARSRVDPTHFLDTDITIHGVIVRMAGNPILTRIMNSLSRWARSGREFTNINPEMRETALRDHREIAAALRSRDAHRAEVAMRTHLEHVQGLLSAQTPQQTDQQATS